MQLEQVDELLKSSFTDFYARWVRYRVYGPAIDPELAEINRRIKATNMCLIHPKEFPDV